MSLVMLNNTLEDRKRKTRLVLEEVYSLPAMSKMVVEISKMLDDPRTNNVILEKLISKDQGIASKVLAIANSPLYGLRRKVSTIDFAILVIGFAEMKSIVLALSVMQALQIKSGNNFNHIEFWSHSTVMGAASRRIMEDLGFNKGSEVLMAGLLHDMGIGVIFKFFKNEFELIYKDVNEHNIDITEAQIKHLGYTHQEIGNIICDNWNLPEHLCDAILYHEMPSQSGKDKIVPAIVHLCDYLTQKFEMGSFYWDKDIKFDEGVLELLHFSSMSELDEFSSNYRSLFEQELENIKII